MSKRNGDRAKHNREEKKRKTKQKRVQGLRKFPDNNVTEPVAANPDQGVTSRLRQLTGDQKTDAAGFEIVLYRSQQGEQSD